VLAGKSRSSGCPLFVSDRRDWLKQNVRIISSDGTALDFDKQKAAEINDEYEKAQLRRMDQELQAIGGLTFPDGQLQSKFKHAGDFGVDGNYNPANEARFREAVDNFIKSPDNQVIDGLYRGQPSRIYVNPSTRQAVITQGGKFVSGWKLSVQQLQNLLNAGRLN
jgi:hypothetical protein